MTYPQPFNYFGEAGFTRLQGDSANFYYNAATDKMHYRGGPQIEGILSQTVDVVTDLVLNISMQYFPGPENYFIARLIIDGVIINEQTDGANGTNWGSSSIYAFAPGTHTIGFYFFSPPTVPIEVDIGISDYFQLGLHPTIYEIPDPVDSEKISEVFVSVSADIQGYLAGVNLDMSVPEGNLDKTTGTTDTYGQSRFIYTAPRIISAKTETISVLASKPGYIEGSTSDDITIIPTLIPSLLVRIFKCPDRIYSGEKSDITIKITDNNNMPVTGAAVEISVTGGSLDISTGITDTYGNVNIIYTAPFVGADTIFPMTAIASSEDYMNIAIGSTDILVSPIV